MRRSLAPHVALVAFFTLAFAYSWCFWIVAALAAARAGGPADRTLTYAGIPGPFVAALVLLCLTATRVERGDFWQRVYEVERLRPRWLAAVLLVYPLSTVLAVGLDRLAGAPWPDMARLTPLLSDPVLLLANATFTFLLGPLPEELGWRGYALDHLLKLRSALTASVVLGMVWVIWHLPLFLMPGTYQYNLGLGSQAFGLFSLTAVSSSILITWIYQHNDRSIFAAILFHAILNLTRSAVTLPDRTELIRTGLVTLVAVVGVVRYRPGTLKSRG